MRDLARSLRYTWFNGWPTAAYVHQTSQRCLIELVFWNGMTRVELTAEQTETLRKLTRTGGCATIGAWKVCVEMAGKAPLVEFTVK